MDHLVATQALHLKEEYGHLEKDLAVSIADHPQNTGHVLSADSQSKLLSLLCMLPHGVIKWSHAVPGRRIVMPCLHWCDALHRCDVAALHASAGARGFKGSAAAVLDPCFAYRGVSRPDQHWHAINLVVQCLPDTQCAQGCEL